MMCWKEEWAYAINNLNRAIAHIERAQEKMLNRRMRAQKWYENLSKDKKHGTPKELAKVHEIIDKCIAGEKECYNLKEWLYSHQRALRDLIENYGLERQPGGSTRVQQILQQTFKEAES